MEGEGPATEDWFRKEGPMMKTRFARHGVVTTALVATALLTASSALAVTKYQTSLVPNVAGETPGFATTGSSISIDGHGLLKGKIKKVVDGSGLAVTTDPLNPADNYSVEVDLAVAATATSGTVTVSFDVKKGNGNFSADISADPVLANAVLGDGVAVTGVRVRDGGGNVLGTGGVAIQ
jgi:hypothetical protein